MDLKRITSVSLLVVYGLLAAVGPCWHQHSHRCADCCHSLATPENAAPDKLESQKTSPKKHRFGCCDGSCSHHHAANRDVTDETRPVESENTHEPCNTDHRGNCVVCDFYAKAYFANAAVELPQLCVALPLCAAPTAEIPFATAVPSLARGPPADFC